MRLQLLRSEIRRRGWKVFSGEGELNIVGVRSESTQANAFDDQIHVFYREGSRWVHHRFAATTDPGTYYLRNPLHPQGTALLAEQQAVGAYSIDLHQGRYPALCQRLAPVEILRDYDRNAELDFGSPRRYRGYFGINLHRASASGSSTSVDRWSAGCQVFQRSGDFELFIRLCEAHRSRWGNSFSYSLIDLRALKRRRRARRLKWASLGLASLVGLVLSAPKTISTIQQHFYERQN